MSLRRAILVWLLLSVLASLMPRDLGLVRIGWPFSTFDRDPTGVAAIGGLTAAQRNALLNLCVPANDFTEFPHEIRLRVSATAAWAIRPVAIILDALLPAFVTWAAGAVVYYRRVLRAISACETCGYSLIGNTSGRCPECGTAVPAQESEPRP